MSKGGGDNTTQKQNLRSKSRNIGSRRREEEKEEKCACKEGGKAKKMKEKK